jgi:ketosteroid isomerase-like protein
MQSSHRSLGGVRPSPIHAQRAKILFGPLCTSWEFLKHMNHFLVCCSALLFSCVAAAQNPISVPAPPAATPSATPAPDKPGVTSIAPPEIAQFQKIEDSWSDAVNRRDQYALELVLSPLFVDVSASGDVTTRNQQVVLVINGEDKTVSLSQKVVTVRTLGDIAVVNGTYTLHHKLNGNPVDEKGVFTHVFERVRAGWLCINSQRTILRQDNSPKQKKAPTGSTEPFHIPLFSKGDKGPQ